jgi:hypothetical protein
MWVVHYILSILNFILDSSVYKCLIRLKTLIEDLKFKFKNFLTFYWIYKNYTDNNLFYNRDRRRYISLLWRLWRFYLRYNHLLPNWERFLFRDLMSFFLHYWLMCKINLSFRSFLSPKYEVLNIELLHAFRKNKLFSNEMYHKKFIKKVYKRIK